MFHIDYDPKINAKNIAETGLNFNMAWEFDWTNASLCTKAYMHGGSQYYRAVGKIRGRLYQLVFQLEGETVIVFGLRRLMKGEDYLYDLTQHILQEIQQTKHV